MRRKSYIEIQQKVQKLKPEYQKMLEDCLVLFKKCNVDYKQDRGNMMVQFYNLLKCHYEVLTPNVTEEMVKQCEIDLAKYRPALDQVLKDNGLLS